MNEDRYDQVLALADAFDATSEEMRTMARLSDRILGDEAVSDSAELSRSTYQEMEEAVRRIASSKHGLVSGSIELDADALTVRATVQTYRWIDDLQEAAYETLGSIAGRAIGYLAPEVELGGALVSAGLIETDALDRDGVAAYLGELAEQNPELMDHVTGGGGLLESMQMRSLLTAAVLAGPQGPAAARGGLRAIGADDFGADASAALRDLAGGLVETIAEPAPDPAERAAAAVGSPPAGLAELMRILSSSAEQVRVDRVGASRYIAYLPGPEVSDKARLRLVNGDTSAYAAQVVSALETATDGDPDAHVMLVGAARGGVAAAEVAAAAASTRFVIDQVITAGAPSAHVPLIPAHTRVLSLERRTDPIALLGSLINAGIDNRTTVVLDNDGDTETWVAGGDAVDRAEHAQLSAELSRIRSLGYLPA